jgi:sterol desaturase/sphingolipid hydroxylase (fatty acid hydroxylase superfamily)
MKQSISVFLLNIAVALYLFATGILGLSGKSWFRDGEIRRAVTGIFKGELAETVIIVLAILSIAAGLFILLKLFSIEIPLAEICLIILAVVWIVFIILVDVIYPLNHRGANFVDWLRSIGSHLMVLGGITLATERFGG